MSANSPVVEFPKERRLFIAGQWVEAIGGGRLDVINPADESVLANVAHGHRADADRAVGEAVKAFPAWRGRP